MRTLLTGVSVAIFMAGCYTAPHRSAHMTLGDDGSLTREEPPRLAVSSDSTEFSMPEDGSDLHVALVIRNTDNTPAVLCGCPRPPAVKLQRLTGREWEDVGWGIGIFCKALFSTECVAVTPGEFMTADVPVRSSGRFRCCVLVGPFKGSTRSEVLSNEFEVY